MFDFHTHNLQLPPGSGIVCLPQRIVRQAEGWQPVAHAKYAAGIHPWWTADVDFRLDHYLAQLSALFRHPEVEQLGECGFDRLRGADIATQTAIFEAQIALSERFARPVTLHVVRAFDIVLAMKKKLRPSQQWTVHGFRGNARLAQQLLDAGLDLSFGRKRNAAAFALTPPDRRHEETDDEA